MAITFLTNEDEKKFVKTVNGVAPDENGNVEVDVPEGGQNVTHEPANDDIPHMYFTLDGWLPTTKGEGEIRCQMRYISKTDDFSYPVTMKVQGGSSAQKESYKKKNYTMKVYVDDSYEDKAKLAFKSWSKMNKFVLKAHWVNPSHIRNVGTAKLAGQVVRSRSDFDTLPEELRTSPNNGATDGFSVRVWVNGIYWGIYELIVAKDKLFGQDSDNPAHSILNSDLNNSPVCAFSEETDTLNGWTEELQDSITADTKASFINLINFVATSTNAEFIANAEQYFDVQSVIDFDIMARLFCIVDNLCKNQIFFKYDTKWYEGFWDLDGVLGLPPTIVSWYSYDTAFQEGYVAYAQNGMTNLLYKRVEECFLDRFKARYWELRNSVLSIPNVLSVYERLTDVLKSYDGLLAEDYASTTGNGEFTTMPNVSSDTIQQIRQFVHDRWAYMDDVITNLTPAVECTGIALDKTELTFSGVGTQTLAATVTPDDCTDVIVWNSDNDAVATVEDGVVTAVGNGSATITATCGNYSANCSVTVSGTTVHYSVTNSLTNATSSNSATSVEENTAYTATLTADEGYALESVSVTMGGNDITDDCYADGIVSISSVTGNVTITATATAQETADGGILEGVTWTAGFINTSGVIATSTKDAYTSAFDISGYDTFYVNIARTSGSLNQFRMCFYNTDNTFVGYITNSVDKFYMAGDVPDGATYARISANTQNGFAGVTIREVAGGTIIGELVYP